MANNSYQFTDWMCMEALHVLKNKFKVTNKFKMECGKLHDGTVINAFDILGSESQSEKAREKTAFKDSAAFQFAKSQAGSLGDQATNVFAAAESAKLEAENLIKNGQLTEREKAALLSKASALALAAKNSVNTRSTSEAVAEEARVSKIPNRSTAEEERASRLNKIFSENIPGYNLDPEKAFVSNLIVTNLGNVFK